MAKVFLQSTTDPKVRFEILKRDPATGVSILKGQYAEFEEVITKDVLKKYKYRIERVEDHAH